MDAMSDRVLKMALVAAALLLSVTVHATALVGSLSGDVRVVSGGQALVPVEQGERLDSGSTVITGADGLAILRFDDQQKVAILRNSEFTVVDYNYSAGVATADRSELALNRGAVRILSGRIARSGR